MLSHLTKNISMVIILVWGTFACPALFAQEDYIQYEFDNPDKVFQTTTSESVIGSGADPIPREALSMSTS